VVITLPDKTTKTLGPLVSFNDGGAYTTFTPAIVGNYTVQGFFGGQTLTNLNPANPSATPNAYVGDYYQPSKSSVLTLTVQQEPISSTPDVPFPTDYWTRPIYAENNNWYSIGGNWLGAGVAPGMYNATGNYNPYTTAPTTSHILWTKPVAFGGTVGGDYGGSQTGNYYSTSQYEVKFSPIIINGVLYYQQIPGSNTSPAGWVAVNLRTGQTVWTSNYPKTAPSSLNLASTPTEGTCTTLKQGQVFYYTSPNQYGSLAYLWSTGTPTIVASVSNVTGTTYNMFDAMTGNYILSIVNGTTFSALVNDPQGSLIGYYINSSTANAYNAPTLNCWNSTKAIDRYDIARGILSATSFTMWEWRPPQGGIIPFSYGSEWSMPIATNMSGNPIALAYSGIGSGVILMDQYSSAGPGSSYQNGWIVEAGYSSDNGKLLWGPLNRTENVGTRVSFGSSSGYNTGYSIGNGYWVELDLALISATGYNLLTGEKVWGPLSLPNANSWDSLGMLSVVANGTIYVWGLGGDVYSINMATGTINWQYHTPSGGYDSPYGVMPIWTVEKLGTVAGGMLFLPEGHEFAPPLFRGAQQLALNTTNGQLVWNILACDVDGPTAIADGIMTTLNAYDNQLYAFGMGPSKTTVNAPSVGVTTSTPVTITGTVTDISAGSKQEAVAANFPNGLPCVSDASMSHFMEAVYMQQPMPSNTTGVPVTLSVIDSNGNYRQIGTTTSDSSGMFSFTWTPDIQGSYTVWASFAGSNSFYGSSAETSFHASAAPATSTPIPVTALPPTEMYIGAAAAAIIIAIALSTVLIVKMQRKRP
jgi:outer membrane protein assembly factor BamB